MWTDTNIYRENGALYDIFIWKIFYVTTVLRIFNITKIELVLPTFKSFKSWSVHKIIEYLALGLLCSLWNIYHSTTAYFFDPPCIYLQLKYTTRHWLISSGLQTRSRRSVVVMTTHYHVDSRETSLQAYVLLQFTGRYDPQHSDSDRRFYPLKCPTQLNSTSIYGRSCKHLNVRIFSTQLHTKLHFK